jgi:hypothetical protein
MHYTSLITVWLHYMNQQYFSLVPLREQSTDLYSKWLGQMTCASFSQPLSTPMLPQCKALQLQPLSISPKESKAWTELQI